MIFREEPSLEHDVLAVLQRGDATITFITAKADSLNGQDYSVVMWSESSLVLAISEDYLNSELDEKVINLLVDGLGDDEDSPDAEYLRSRALEVFAFSLSDILDEALSMVTDPESANLDAAIEKLLDES